jgi:hypothetical protein
MTIDPRYTTLRGFANNKIRRANYKSFCVRKEEVITEAMRLISEYLAEQIRRENQPG